MKPNRSEPRLTAYYKITLSLFFWVLGGAGLIASLWIAFQAKSASVYPYLSALLFVSIGLFGVYCLNRPYFLLEPKRLTVYNLFGIVTKQYTFESWDVVKADSRRIYIDDEGITKKVPVAPWLVKTDDWITMRKLL
jgi:hypothetical protein